MTRPRIAAGWFVGVGVTFVVGGVPTSWLSVWARAAMILGGLMCLCAAAYERWLRTPEGTEPRVALEMPTSGVFMLRNSGSRADAVTISDITVENRYRMTFPPIFDLRGEVTLEPKVEPIGWSAAVEADRRTNMTVQDFLNRMARDKAISIQEVRTNGLHVDSETTEALVQKGMTPLRFPLLVTVRSGASSRTHREVLMFDSSKQVAWLEHPTSDD